MELRSPKALKKSLFSIISDMDSHADQFVKRPGIDFTRNRKITFGQTVSCILQMGATTLRKELLSFFNNDINCIKKPSFCEQRDKICTEAFEHLFQNFTSSLSAKRTYQGYRLLACDGSTFQLAYNRNDKDTYLKGRADTKGHNQLHLHALYDLCNHIYVDALITPIHSSNEPKAAVSMMKRSLLSNKTILIADRGYEAFNLFGHAQEKGWNYLIRVKDLGKRSVLDRLKFPDSDEFDYCTQLTLTKSHTQEIKDNPQFYRYFNHPGNPDFIDFKEHPFYTLPFRAVRFKLSDDEYECIITNLPVKEFSTEQIKELYRMRWGIETSFRKLKYTIGLKNFHAKKSTYVCQEIYARLTLYNFCEVVAMGTKVAHNCGKYNYQVDFTMAVYHCRNYLKGVITIRALKKLVAQDINPIRPDRKYPCDVDRSNRKHSFQYRIS